MAIRITTLSENTADALRLLAEWGLSILVETETVNVLLDTGQSISVVHNADALGIDLRKVDKIVLSHGHADHTGGLWNVLERMGKKVEVVAHPDVRDAKYAGQQEDKRRNISIPFHLEDLEKLGAVFKFNKEPVKIADNIMTTGEVPMVTDFEQITPNRFYVKENSGWQSDEIKDDLALVISTRLGLIVILGCGHRGMINTLYHAQKLTGRKEIRMVIGGCHLIDAPLERVYMTIEALRELDVQKVGVSHCTGLEASAIMAQELGERFFYNNACTRIDVTDKEIKVD
ncbi:MAG: MBL fold metallo-hydrolase [Dehalococcoidales bacterium]|nr:MBL fold metallo-hydrolase [Dehalococcoidales bacterium]